MEPIKRENVPPIQETSPTHHAPENYDERHRWFAYWYQIDAIRRSGARKILEIGTGSGTLTLYMRHQLQLEVDTFDYDERMRPTYQGDIRQIGQIVPHGSYDAVLAFQVLEHIPFDDLPATLEQIAQITRHHFLASIPHRGNPLQLRFHFWRFNVVFSRKIIRPGRIRPWKFDGMHHWEIGATQYPMSRVLDTFRGVFMLKKHYFCPDYAYHYFLECERHR